VAIEDSRNGMLAAYQAGISVMVTVSEYTADEDFSEADLVVSSLGDPAGPETTVLANRSGVAVGSFVTLEVLAKVIESAASKASA
jgi:beta-phosphoglucomutase-like phosphatase (HAD superfamily)